jgi:transposase-like protein
MVVSTPKGAYSMGKKSELGAAERRDAVLTLLRREEPAAVLARRCGISEQTLYRWRDEFLAAGEAALLAAKGGADARNRQIEELKRELARRDQVIGELTIANRLLKKVRTACFEQRVSSGGQRGVDRRRGHAADEVVDGLGHFGVELVPPARAGTPTSSAGPAAEDGRSAHCRDGRPDGDGESVVRLPADRRDVSAVA